MSKRSHMVIFYQGCNFYHCPVSLVILPRLSLPTCETAGNGSVLLCINAS